MSVLLLENEQLNVNSLDIQTLNIRFAAAKAQELELHVTNS